MTQTRHGFFCAALIAIGAACAAAEPAPVQVKITAPADGSVVAGVTPVAVSVAGADNGAKVSFYIDGRLAFVDSTAPYA